MLKLISVTKDYKAGDSVVHALKGINLSFRKSEFVSVLGPSGCGKTTLLNIIGGLDHYTDGELIIDGVSTKDFTDRDWDTYRNSRIGFVFQSYNLIPHQTISENVELALNISGVEKAERVRRAHEALDKVGLKDQYDKKPNQLSGGQCQRVAIARALVGNPEILLADEPTGALDTTTSVQIMDLIQEIAKERLVIMVTHNPDLADKYSTRIIRLLDGEIVDDTYPFDEESEPLQADDSSCAVEQCTDEPSASEKKKAKRKKQSKLSLWSAFRLSAKNLWSKMKRTVLVCVAGSIGIIGVASVLAVSQGTQNYIHSMQNDMLSGNPVTISTEALDLNSVIAGRSNAVKADAVKASIVDGYINVDEMISYLVERSENASSFKVSNDITDEYVSYVKSMPKEYYSAITTEFGLNLSNNLYTDFAFDGATVKTSLSVANQTYKTLLEKSVPSGDESGLNSFSQYFSLIAESFMQAPDDADFILSQYDVISNPQTSKIATEADEIMIVVDDNNALSDILLAQYGYYSQEEFWGAIYKAIGLNYDQSLWKDRFSYDELTGKTFVWYPNDTVFNVATSPSSPAAALSYNPYPLEDWQGKELKITAILKPKDGLSYGCLQSGFYYTSALAKEIIADSMQSQIVKYVKSTDSSGITSVSNNGVKQGLTYTFSTWLDGVEDTSNVGIIGSENTLSGLLGASSGQNQPGIYTLSLREMGGVDVPENIKIYPTDFDYKDDVTAYLDKWNKDGDIVVDGVTLTKEQRSDIVYTDNLALVIGIVNNLIDIVTAALVAFTALSLVVSTVMIAIITYVSVMERVKEIGVIRSLGGRKSDVSALFNAETFIIGSISGIIGIAFTYLLSFIINQIVGSMFGIYTIAALPFTTALIMIAISIALTMIAGIIPASLAAKKDPVDALRSE